jgi:hypothetical protein
MILKWNPFRIGHVALEMRGQALTGPERTGLGVS